MQKTIGTWKWRLQKPVATYYLQSLNCTVYTTLAKSCSCVEASLAFATGELRSFFQTSKGHVTWIIKKVNRIPTRCGVAYQSVHSLARGHVIRVYVHTAADMCKLRNCRISIILTLPIKLDMLREWLFNTDGEGSEHFWGLDFLGPMMGLNFCSDTEGWVEFFHASLASIFNKNNWIWVYKIWARGGVEFFMHSNGVLFFVHAKRGWIYFESLILRPLEIFHPHVYWMGAH